MSDAIDLPVGFFQDPHAFYRSLRPTGPVHRVRLPSGETVWLVTDYELARTALTDPSIRKHAPAIRRAGAFNAVSPVNRLLSEHMLNMDPPQHTRQRGFVSHAFTTIRAEGLRPRIEAIAEQLLHDMGQQVGPIDLLDAYALPLPLAVICELLGIPATDTDQFRAGGLRPVMDVGGFRDPRQMRTESDALADYLTDLVAHRRRHRGADLISSLVFDDEGSDRLTDEEIVSMAFLILVAGQETTVNLIGNTLMMLLADRAKMDAVVSQPELVPALLEEVLRYEGAVGMATLRYTTKPITLGNIRIGSDQPVLVALVAGNRDPSRFPQPDTFDLTREANRHIAFGHGIHHCVGAPLARLEGRIAVTRLIERYPQIALACPPEQIRWWRSIFVRGLTRLPVTLQRRSPLSAGGDHDQR